MKKTTKILLVLAAIVAMTIGAVSTVMAADEFPEIAEWSYNSSTKKYSAVDTNGETIVRGWATDDNQWYWFDSSVMVANTFITYKEDIYYLDKNGLMAIGWIEFAGTGDEAKVNVVDKYDEAITFPNVTSITGFNNVFDIDTEDAASDPIFQDLFVEDAVNETVWCYFDEHGVMASDEWIKTSHEQWFYMYGPYCVMDDFKVAIELDGDAVGATGYLTEDNEGYFGFGKDGVMLVGWVANDVSNNDSVTGSNFDSDTPYEDNKAGKDATSTRSWVYYHTNGRLVNTTPAELEAGVPDEGWENIGGQWTYFIEDDVTGMKLLQNTVLFDVDTDLGGLLEDDGQKGTFYLDPNGYMVTGLKTFTKNVDMPTWDEANTSDGTIDFKVATSWDGIFYFDNTIGKMLDGIIGYYYYKDFTAGTDRFYLVESADITTDGVIELDESAASLTELDGQRVTGKNFFLVTEDVNDLDGDDEDDDMIVLYFESGRWQKNQGITFGETTIAIDANGVVLGVGASAGTDVAVKVAGFQYKYDDTTLTLADDSIVIQGVTRK